jgi:hypothetical protein
MDGWNGRICRDPASNVYCVGNDSYPGPLIREKRDLDWESRPDVAGRCCTEIEGIPPCIYSINAFGSKELTAYADIPEWLYPPGSRKEWVMPPATISIWPYEQMYREEVSRGSKYGQKYDYDQRLEYAKDYFSKVDEGRSLVFYYSNYSNPFSEEDQRRYVVTGVSRIKKLGELQFHEDIPTDVAERYGGAYVWQMNVTSNYPDEGLRLPYHLYLDQPEIVDRFLFVPDNSRNFKYATRHISDDDALDLVERFLEITGTLEEIGDKSEDWAIRRDWLHSLIAELWDARGLFPGLPKVLDHIGFGAAVPFFKDRVEAGEEKDAKAAIFAFLEGDADAPPEIALSEDDAKRIARSWKLLDDDVRQLLDEVLPRFDLAPDQIGRIVGDGREGWGIHSPLSEIAGNPYVLSEQFIGNGPDDMISFSKIDHGAFPSPELGGETLAEVDDWRRLRGLIVERLKREQKDVFVAAAQIIHDVNHRLSFLPDWKRHQFTERYLEVDEEELEGALTFRIEDARRWIYLKHVYEDERLIESTLRDLAARASIELRTPVTSEHWRNFLYNPDSSLATRAGDAYRAAIEGQVAVCEEVFARPLSVVSGAAGTGKTTVINALLQAIERSDGRGATFQLLAPTGKAAERLRDATDKRYPTATIHSFLAKNAWLNDNLTFRRHGGTREDSVATIVVDEASMLSLDLLATLLRAVQWKAVRRLILVGDPNQLPPIGRGRAFADVIDWLNDAADGSVGILQTNIRQMENRALGRGTALLDLASAFVRRAQQAEKDEVEETHAELVLRRAQEGGEVDQDLRVLYWRDAGDLQQLLVETIVADMENDCGSALDLEKPWALWREAFGGNSQRPEYLQVISPYRGEEFGIDNLNRVLQESVHGKRADELRHIDGIALFDKVIQIRNRPRSNRIWAYRPSTKTSEQIEIYNGYLGFTKPHGYDAGKLGWAGFRPKRLQVIFSNQRDYQVGYGSKLGKAPTGKWMPPESVEDNLDLAYAVSVHKAQGSEFERVYLVIPKHKKTLLSRELFYTGLTRATRHCTLLVEDDIAPLLTMQRVEQSHLLRVNASLFTFDPVPDELRVLGDWYEEGKIHSTLTSYMVRSKSEVIIANMLFERDIPFRYETPLFAKDGTFYLPDFTVTWNGEDWYWEHVGRLDREDYRNHWETKQEWYERFFPGRLVMTLESGDLSKDSNAIIEAHFS